LAKSLALPYQPQLAIPGAQHPPVGVRCPIAAPPLPAACQPTRQPQPTRTPARPSSPARRLALPLPCRTGSTGAPNQRASALIPPGSSAGSPPPSETQGLLPLTQNHKEGRHRHRIPHQQATVEAPTVWSHQAIAPPCRYGQRGVFQQELALGAHAQAVDLQAQGPPPRSLNCMLVPCFLQLPASLVGWGGRSQLGGKHSWVPGFLVGGGVCACRTMCLVRLAASHSPFQKCGTEPQR
jgi:hypothetical protein